jgi:hypothetical protein
MSKAIKRFIKCKVLRFHDYDIVMRVSEKTCQCKCILCGKLVAICFEGEHRGAVLDWDEMTEAFYNQPMYRQWRDNG